MRDTFNQKFNDIHKKKSAIFFFNKYKIWRSVRATLLVVYVKLIQCQVGDTVEKKRAFLRQTTCRFLKTNEINA